jgi:hypothetical protein
LDVPDIRTVRHSDGMRRDQRLGLTIGSVFGLVFVLVNAGALPSPWPLVVRACGVLAFVAVQLALRAAAQRPAAERGDGAGFNRGFGIVVAVEVVALFGGLQVLGRVFDAPDAGVAWISLVVGLHFVALAVVWGESSLHVLGGAVTVCGVAGLVLAATGADPSAVAAVAGVVPGFILLAAGGWAAARSARVPQDA